MSKTVIVHPDLDWRAERAAPSRATGGGALPFLLLLLALGAVAFAHRVGLDIPPATEFQLDTAPVTPAAFLGALG